MDKIQDPKLLHGVDLSKHLKEKEAQENADKRTKECEKELMVLLDKYNCGLDAVMVIGRNGNIPQVTLVAKK
jgi:hypothetical protein